MLPVVAVCIIAIVLVAEKLTGRLASLLDHEIFARHAPRWRLFDRAPSDPATTPEVPEGGLPPTDNYNMVAGKCFHCHCRPPTQLLSTTGRIHNL